MTKPFSTATLHTSSKYKKEIQNVPTPTFQISPLIDSLYC